MRKHKLLAVLLALAMTISLLPTAAAAESGYRDTDGHWAETAIDRWSGYGIIQGNNGAFNPNGALTRAHMAAILTRLLGLPAADSAGFTDVDEGAWYAEYINRCAAAGIMLGANGKASPNALITRQQAMVMLARALGIQPVKNPDLSAYKDGGAVSEYARGYVAALIEAGIVSGVSADTLGCGSSITRAATVTILDRSITTYANRPDSRVEAVSGGIVLVAADGVELTGSADSVLVTQGAADGTVTLDGVTADSVLVLGENTTVLLEGDSKAETVTVSETAEGAQVVVEEDAKVTTVVTEAPESKVSVSGRVGDVVTAESAREAAVEVAKGGRVEEITAAGEKTDIAVSGKVENVTVEESAEDTTVEAGTGGVISKVDNAAEGTTVSGKGKVESVTTSGDNTTVTTKGTEVEVEKGTTGTTAGGKDVSGGTTVTTPGSSGGSSSGGSSSGGGSSHSHRYTYQDNGDGTHTGTCSCGEKTSPEAHKVDDTGACTVCGADGFVARIGTTGYKNLQDALNVGGEVVLIRDVEIDATKTSAADRLTISKPTTLTLNAKIIAPGELEPTDNWAALYIAADTTINANANGGIQCKDKVEKDEGGPYGINIINGAEVTINSGTYYGGGTAVQLQKGDLTINGGTFEVTPFGDPYGYKYVINVIDKNYKDGTATIAVKGGTFVKFDPSANPEGPDTSYVADGYSVVQDGENYKVLEGTYVSTEEELNEQIKNGTASEIHLAGDIELTNNLSVSRDVTLVGHGYAISKYPTYVGAETNVVFQNVKFEDNTATDKGSSVYGSGFMGTMTFIECAFGNSNWESIQVTPKGDATVLIQDCTFTATKDMKRFIHIEPDPRNTLQVNVAIENCLFTGCEKVNYSNSDTVSVIDMDYFASGSTMTLGGCEFFNTDGTEATNAHAYFCDANGQTHSEYNYDGMYSKLTGGIQTYTVD